MNDKNAVWKRFTRPDHGYTIKHPANWKYENTLDAISVGIGIETFYLPSKNGLEKTAYFVVASAFELDKKINMKPAGTLEEFVAEQCRIYSTHNGFMRRPDRRIGRLEFKHICHLLENECVAYKADVYFVSNGFWKYQISFVCRNGEQKKYKEIFEQALKSFKFEKAVHQSGAVE